MATKLGRKEMPAGLSADDFKYMGRPANDQGDFGSDVGIADMGCVNQFGEANNAKYYHAGVVQGSGRWFVYLEWGRMKAAKSWNGGFGGGDFQFVECTGEGDARDFFAKQCGSKNVKRLIQQTIAGKLIWTAKKGKDGYLVQRLATREKGLPDAYTIKDDSGVTKTAAPKAAPKAKKAAKPSRTFQPEVASLAAALVGGTKTYARSLSAASGITPTMDTINEVRNDLIPAALDRIKKVGNDVHRQVEDNDLIALSKLVAALVPRPIPRGGQDATEAILSANNILVLQQDLDAFEAALGNEDFSTATKAPDVDPDSLLNAKLTWLDPRGDAAWLASAFTQMSNNRHGYLGRGSARVKHIFMVERPDRDAPFMAKVAAVGSKRKGRFGLKANLQPRRKDLNAQEADLFAQANVIMAIHGTRPVNIAPILGDNFRLPRSLPGAQITGANFGHGVYFATDWRKSYGYTGRGYYGGGGGVANRGCFMFLCDMVMGNAYRAPSTGSWGSPPGDTDSVFGVGGDRGHRLENDEHVIFDPHYQRIRYIIEFDWLN